MCTAELACRSVVSARNVTPSNLTDIFRSTGAAARRRQRVGRIGKALASAHIQFAFKCPPAKISQRGNSWGRRRGREGTGGGGFRSLELSNFHAPFTFYVFSNANTQAHAHRRVRGHTRQRRRQSGLFSLSCRRATMKIQNFKTLIPKFPMTRHDASFFKITRVPGIRIPGIRMRYALTRQRSADQLMRKLLVDCY